MHLKHSVTKVRFNIKSKGFIICNATHSQHYIRIVRTCCVVRVLWDRINVCGECHADCIFVHATNCTITSEYCSLVCNTYTVLQYILPAEKHYYCIHI